MKWNWNFSEENHFFVCFDDDDNNDDDVSWINYDLNNQWLLSTEDEDDEIHIWYLPLFIRRFCSKKLSKIIQTNYDKYDNKHGNKLRGNKL